MLFKFTMTAVTVNAALPSGRESLLGFTRDVIRPVVRSLSRLDGASRNKTTKMRVIESALGEPIELLLVGQSVGQAAKKLGLNKGTVSTWRRWLGLK